MKFLTRIPPFVLPMVALVAIGGLLVFWESDFLWKLQETNLFLCSRTFFEEQLVEPGGLLTWVSTWFTQFFFHPWVGTLLLCGWWLLLMWLIKSTFRVSGRWMPVIIIPVLLLLVTIVETGYWIYILKLQGHAFLGTIGTTAAVALLWVFRNVVERVQAHPTLLRSAFILITSAVGYPLMGVYGVGTAALMAVWIWRLEPRRASALAVSVTGLLGAGLLPLLFYRFVYYQTNIANVFAARLPLFVVKEEYTIYYLPYVLLLGFLVVMCLPLPAPQKRPWKAAPLLLLLAACIYTAHFWYHDENFHHELAMQRCIDRLD